MIAKKLKNYFLLITAFSTVGSLNQSFAQTNWDNKPKIIITQRPQTVPQGKRWLLLSGEKTKIQISDGTLTSGTLCNAMFFSNPRITFNINKGDYRNPETFGVIFKNLTKVPYTNDYTYTITPISIIDSKFSLNDLQYKSLEIAGSQELDFNAGETVYLVNCLESIELTEVDVKESYTMSSPKIPATYCYSSGEYSVKIAGRNATIFYTDINHLDRSHIYKGYIDDNKIYVRESSKYAKYVWEFTLSKNHQLSMFDNNKKAWITLKPCNEVSVNKNAVYRPKGSMIQLNNSDSSASSQSDKNDIYAAVEQSPEFPGGVNALQKFINANIKYSDEMQKANISGKVIVSFVVEVDGSLSNINIIKDLGLGTAEEAKRIFALSPKWKPGLINGKPVRVLWNLPVIFDTANE